MSFETLRDLLAQASVDEGLQIKLVSAAYSIDDILKVAIEAGYNISKEDLASLKELSDEELASVAGGQQDHKKWIDILSIGLN
jgi:predicted ribosomally synthesized peptide with nif11-like leader